MPKSRRLARRDPLPKDMKLLGSFVYTPDSVLFRGLSLSGDTLSLRSDHGAVSPRDGKLDIPVMEMAGRGAPLGRVLQYFGVTGAAQRGTDALSSRRADLASRGIARGVCRQRPRLVWSQN